MHDVVIVGAGIAGLSAAWELRARDIRPVILERSARPGGVIVTDRIDGFVIDGGPDSLLVQKPAAVELCRELGIADRLHPTRTPRTAYVLKDAALVPLPEASFLGLPTSIWSLLSTRLFSWPAKLRMAAEAFKPARRDGADESIGGFMRRRFGREAVTYLAEPLLAGIHAGDVDRLSIHALFPRLVEAEDERGSVLRAVFAARTPRAPHGAFVSLPGGVAELVEALVERLGDAVQYSTTVERIDRTGPFNVTLGSGNSIDARSVIVATPAWAATTILQPVDPALSELCAEIRYASSATVVFAIPRAQIPHPLEGTGFVVPRVEGRAVLAATWVSSKWPNRAPLGHALLRAVLGGANDPDVLERSDDELAEIAFGELASILGISGAPSLTRIYRWPRATPQYIVGHLDRVRRIDERLSRIPGLYLTGSGYRGTGIPDCIADARATAARAASFLR